MIAKRMNQKEEAPCVRMVQQPLQPDKALAQIMEGLVIGFVNKAITNVLEKLDYTKITVESGYH